MIDELDRLRHDERLLLLLEHYAEGNSEQRDRWQDRVMVLEGVRTEDLRRLHGELLAFEWVEQNTGMTPGAEKGSVRHCYRLASGGRRALRQFYEDQRQREREAQEEAVLV